MSKRTLQANYFADDKDLHDLLSAARQKLPPSKLLEIGRQRGLVFSSEDDREALIDQVALLPCGWRDLAALIEATDTAERTERSASTIFSGSFSAEDLQAGADILSADRSDKRGEVFGIKKTAAGLTVSVKYSELDTSKTRLAQRTAKEFVLELEVDADGGNVLVRHQDQARAYEVLGELVKLLVPPEAHFDEKRVELSGVRDPVLRTAFFLKLIRAVPGFTFEDVKSVRASRFQSATVRESTDQDGISSLESTFGDDVDDSGADGEDGIDTDIAEFIAQVKEVALNGQGILQSPQYQHLTQHDFFVRSIVWTAVEGADGCRVEFQAGFDNGEMGTGFTYAVRGVHKRRGNGELKKTKSSPEAVERTRILRLMERAASASVDAIAALIASSAAAADGTATVDAELGAQQ